MASRICLRESPRSQGLAPITPAHLVATTKSWRRPASQRPRISSVLPTVSRLAPPRAIQDPHPRRLVALQAEGHGAEADPRDLEPGAAEADVAHGGGYRLGPRPMG